MKAALVWAFATIAGATPAAAQQIPMGGPGADDCQLRIDAPSGNWIIDGYDPFGNDTPTASYDLMFRNEGGRECRFYPLFETDGTPLGLSGEAGDRRIAYTLVDVSDNYDATPIAGRTIRNRTHRPVIVAPHSQQLVRYLFSVDTNAIPGDGLFSQRLVVDAEGLDGQPLGNRQLLLGIRVLPSAVMGLAGAFHRDHGQADVDLGELAEGVPAVPLQLQVHSTRRYKLQLASLNNGKLRLSGTDWTVPYQMMVDGKQVPFGSAAVFGVAGRSGMRLDTLPVAFHVGNVDGRRAGTYSDTVTITISVD
ncbi:MAG TPA: hypothetical protein VFT56_07360 [Sphingomonas sp.]|nr:hypothetical protein [Sphingomonas sp.]